MLIMGNFFHIVKQELICNNSILNMVSFLLSNDHSFLDIDIPQNYFKLMSILEDI